MKQEDIFNMQNFGGGDQAMPSDEDISGDEVIGVGILTESSEDDESDINSVKSLGIDWLEVDLQFDLARLTSLWSSHLTSHWVCLSHRGDLLTEDPHPIDHYSYSKKKEKV